MLFYIITILAIGLEVNILLLILFYFFVNIISFKYFILENINEVEQNLISYNLTGLIYLKIIISSV